MLAARRSQPCGAFARCECGNFDVASLCELMAGAHPRVNYPLHFVLSIEGIVGPAGRGEEAFVARLRMRGRRAVLGTAATHRRSAVGCARWHCLGGRIKTKQPSNCEEDAGHSCTTHSRNVLSTQSMCRKTRRRRTEVDWKLIEQKLIGSWLNIAGHLGRPAGRE